MFRYFKAKIAEAEFKAALWCKVYDAVNNFPDIVELAKKTKGMDTTDVQKLIVEELTNWYTSKEDNKEANDTDGTKVDTDGE